jgi:hypothetical protein
MDVGAMRCGAFEGTGAAAEAAQYAGDSRQLIGSSQRGNPARLHQVHTASPPHQQRRGPAVP